MNKPKVDIDAHYPLLIDGKFVEGIDENTFPSICPATGAVLCTVAEAGKEDVDLAVKAARKAFETWKDMPATKRAKLMNRIADLLEERLPRIAMIEAMDCGKPIRDVYRNNPIDGGSTAAFYRYFAGALLTDEGAAVMLDNETLSMTFNEPIGVVGIISPWNFPLELVNWMIMIALAAGCTIVVKGSSETTLSLAECGKIFSEILPPGVVNIVQGKGSTTGNYILDHPDIDKFSFTGSTEIGYQVGAAAAEKIVPTTLELGGKSAHIVFPDCNWDRAMEAVVHGMISNAGQICISGSRIFLHADIYDKFLAELVKRFKRIKIGMPWDMETEMGTMITKNQMDKVLKYIATGKKEGAKVATGGYRMTEGQYANGFFIKPTILECTNDMCVAQEEIFGPVACVMKFKDEAEVIAMANDSEYGLVGGVWTQDINRAIRVAREIKAGKIWVNCFLVMVPHAPFGGYKKSGLGRQNHKTALQAYQKVKNIIISTNESVLGLYSE